MQQRRAQHAYASQHHDIITTPFSSLTLTPFPHPSLFLQVFYEDGYKELVGWHELRQILVPHKAYDKEITALEKEGYASRASNRRQRVRDMDKEAEEYLPRNGCHYSLPVGKVACHLHEALRLSGLYPHDKGPLASD